jgi:hypothetical protein
VDNYSKNDNKIVIIRTAKSLMASSESTQDYKDGSEAFVLEESIKSTKEFVSNFIKSNKESGTNMLSFRVEEQNNSDSCGIFLIYEKNGEIVGPWSLLSSKMSKSLLDGIWSEFLPEHRLKDGYYVWASPPHQS